MKPCMNFSNETMIEISRARGRMEAWVNRFAKYQREEEAEPDKSMPAASFHKSPSMRRLQQIESNCNHLRSKLEDHITIAVNASKKKQVKQDSLYKAKDVS